MPFNERIKNHRRLLKACLYRLNLIEDAERLLYQNPDLLMDRKIQLISEYGSLMTELTQSVLFDVSMPKVERVNMAELAEKFYANKSS